MTHEEENKRFSLNVAPDLCKSSFSRTLSKHKVIIEGRLCVASWHTFQLFGFPTTVTRMLKISYQAGHVLDIYCSEWHFVF